MLDALEPAIRSLEGNMKAIFIVNETIYKEFVVQAADAAKKGADTTKLMKALAGRSNYVNAGAMEGVPDPGALAIAAAFEAATDAM